MSATERMIAYHMARLKDKNPDVRIKSIQELALLEATQALEPLKTLYDIDPDDRVRKAAQEAGRTLFLLKKNSDNVSSDG